MRVWFPALLIVVLIPPGARASAPAGPVVDAAGAALSAPAPAPVKEPRPIAWTLPAPPPGPPHLARPRRGPKPAQEGLQLQAKPRIWPVRAAQFLGWALVP